MNDQRSPLQRWDDSLAAGVIPRSRCQRCGRTEAYIHVTCTRCSGDDLEFGASAGRGVVYSLTRVARSVRGRSEDGAAAYSVGLVTLDDVDGRVMALIAGGAAIGDTVDVEIDREQNPPVLVARPAAPPR